MSLPQLPDERRHEVETLFLAALDRPTETRRAFVAQACAEAPDLRAEVDSLLDHYEAAGDFLEVLDAGQAAALIEEADASFETGDTTGPYRLVGELGRGGMGVVYLAERADGQFEQQVALKLIKRGMDSDAVVRRFLQERQILARLQHPHIARLLDGGLTGDGRPYFAMAYVDGLPLTDYCDTHRLDIDARLHLFMQACRAVQYAHQNLVIHRDLKPSNILVEPVGMVKLLDFGIARLLTPQAADGTVLTEADLRALTPEYAAPEQVRGDAVTTATDVYALGVVLYELLTGRRPYRFERRTPTEIERVVTASQPANPSMIPSHAGKEAPDLTQITTARNTTPGRLRRRLAGDLDTIVLKALRKEPERRYASAEALLDDLQRHLGGLPVKARRETVRYRAGKFIRRHRIGALATTLVALALLAGLAGTAWQAREKAREAATAEQVTQFLQSVFATADPSQSKGETVTAQELLDRGAERIDDELADQPAVQARMRHVIGNAYAGLGLYDQAVPVLEEAIAYDRTRGPSPALADQLYDLALLQKTYRDDAAAAEPLYQEALDIRRQLYRAPHAKIAQALFGLASARSRLRDHAEAERYFQEAVAMYQALPREVSHDYASALVALGQLRAVGGDRAATEALYREALDIRRSLSGDLDPDVAYLEVELALTLAQLGRHAEAEPMIETAVAIHRTVFGDNHPRLALALSQQANIRQMAQNFEGAAESARAALAIQEATLGTEHYMVAVGYSQLANALQGAGDYAEAEQVARQAITLGERLFGPTNRITLRSHTLLAIALHAQGAYAEAEPVYRFVLETTRSTAPGDSTQISNMLVELGETLALDGRPGDAELLLREGLTMRIQKLGADHFLVAEARSTLGLALLKQERYEEAEPLLRAALITFQAGTSRRTRQHLQETEERLAMLTSR